MPPPERGSRRGAVLLVFAFLLLAGCKDVTSGVVVAKNHEAAYTYVTMECGSYGSSGNCAELGELPRLALTSGREEGPSRG